MVENVSTLVLEDHLIPSDEAAHGALHIAPLTLATWRANGKGPRYVKIGRSVFYRASAIREWLAGQERDPRDRVSSEREKLNSLPTVRHLRRGLSAREGSALISKMIGKKARRPKDSRGQAD